MSWSEIKTAATRVMAVRMLAVVALAALTAGCFQPMYAERTLDGQPGLRDKLASVEVPPLAVPNASPVARLGVNVRNELMFKLYGTATGAPPLYRLVLKLNTNQVAMIVDPNTALPDIQNYGIDASFQLIENATDKVVLTGNTFSRVTYDTPGWKQRFARVRAQRDAEDRASKEIAENISTRLAAFFYAGT